MQSAPRAVVSRRMGHKARALAALLLLVFARLTTAAHSTASQAGDDLPPMNPPVVLQDDPNTPITYEWPSSGPWPLSDDDEALAKAFAADKAVYVLPDSTGPWPLSDDDEALAKAFAADEAAYVLSDYPDDYDYSLTPMLTTAMVAESHRKLAGIDDVFDDIGDWFSGVCNSIRRRILQDDAPAPGPAAAPKPAPAPAPAPKPAPAPAPAPKPAPAPAPKPGAPAPAPAPAPKPSTPTDATDADSTAEETTGTVTTRPATNPEEAVTPTGTRPGETVPAAVQEQQGAAQAAAQAPAGDVSQASVPADIVSVAFRVPVMAPEDFTTTYLPSTLANLAQLTGTPAEQWKATIAAKTATGTRSLLQINPTNVAVSLSILTRNPQLVVYRLAQAPTLVDGSGCATELCVRLVAAGVPVLPGSVQITPDYSSVFQFGREPTQMDSKLAEAQRTGAIVGGVVGGIALLILLLFKYKRVLNCFRGQVASIKAKKRASRSGPQPQQPELPKVQCDAIAPKADPPVKFLSSHDGASHEFPPTANSPHRVARKASGSSSAGQGSTGIPVGPITGPRSAHSVTPWAECEDDDSTGRDQGVAPTAASLAAVQQGGLYRDSNSFRLWASAAQAQGSASTPSNTPTSASGGSHTSKSFEGNSRRPLSPATAADLAAAMPGSPISSPMYAPAAAAPRNWSTSDGRRPTPAAGGSPMHSAATVDVVQLQLMLDAYYAEQNQRLALGSAGGGGAVGSAAGLMPASPVAAAGWGAARTAAPAVAAGSASGAAQGRNLPAYPRGTSVPGTLTTPQAAFNYSTLRTPIAPSNNTPAGSEPTTTLRQQYAVPSPARQQQ